MLLSPRIFDEISPLRAVVVHPPGAEFELMWPRHVEAYRPTADGAAQPNPDYLLFDDLVLMPQLAREHGRLVQVLKAAVGPEGAVLDATALWRRALFEAEGRDALIERVCEADERHYGWRVPKRLRAAMRRMDPHRLVDVLVTASDPETGEQVFRWPAPNLLFSRDIGAVVRDRLVATRARHPARARELEVMAWVLEHHPALGAAPAALFPPLSLPPDDPALALEGGDLIVLRADVIAIGVGHRTTWPAVRAILPALFDAGIEVALVALLPPERGSMHLDTVFTMVSEAHCLVYEPAVGVGGEVPVVRLTRDSDLDAPPRPLGCGWLKALAGEGIDPAPLRCGGRRPVDQAREQWSDGANAFALAPGKIVAYARNLRTLDELSAAGFDILTADDFCRNARGLMAAERRRFVVTIDGFELSRGRGGPRCLTLPLMRGEAPVAPEATMGSG